MALLAQYDQFDPSSGEDIQDPYGSPPSPGGLPVPGWPGVPWAPTYSGPGATPVTTSGGVEPTPPGGGGGGNGGGGGGGYGIGPQFPGFEFGPVPKFDAPAFVRPDAQSLLSAPGYQARQKAGEDALQRSAASKGVLRTGGTLKDLIEYGQNFASNEYNNEFNQALQTYGANYQLAKDKFAPLLAQWDVLSKAEIQKALAAYNRGTIWNNPHAGGGGGGGGTYDPFPDPNGFGL